MLTKKSPIWRWAEVANWFAANYEEYDSKLFENATIIAAINSALELRRHVQKPSDINWLWDVVKAPEQPRAPTVLKAVRRLSRKTTSKRKRSKRRVAAKRKA